MTAKKSDEGEGIVLEVTGQSLPIIRTLLNRIKLGNGITRMRVEIDGEIELQDLEIDSKALREASGESEPEPDDTPGGEIGSARVQSHKTDDTPEPDDKTPVEDVTLNPDTNKWYALATMYRLDTPITTAQLYTHLEGTKWEFRDKGALSATLSDARRYDLVKSNKTEGRGRNEWRLTQYGKDVIEYQINSRKGYHMQIADIILDRYKKAGESHPDT